MSAGVASLRMRVWDGVVMVTGTLKGEDDIVAMRLWRVGRSEVGFYDTFRP